MAEQSTLTDFGGDPSTDESGGSGCSGRPDTCAGRGDAASTDVVIADEANDTDRREIADALRDGAATEEIAADLAAEKPAWVMLEAVDEQLARLEAALPGPDPIPPEVLDQFEGADRRSLTLGRAKDLADRIEEGPDRSAWGVEWDALETRERWGYD